MAGFIPADGQQWPDGECVPVGQECYANPCFPIGQIVVANNWLGSPIRVHYHTYSGNGWQDYTLQNFGQAMAFTVPGITLPCGEEHVAAEVYNDAVDPPIKLGEVRLTCSKCVPNVI
jgi:hypothetical protein